MAHTAQSAEQFLQPASAAQQADIRRAERMADRYMAAQRLQQLADQSALLAAQILEGMAEREAAMRVIWSTPAESDLSTEQGALSAVRSIPFTL